MSRNTELLSEAIFGRPEGELDETEKAFLKLHQKEFKTYKNDYAAQWRITMGISKLKGQYYKEIFDNYCKRVHIHSVIAGIKRGREVARTYQRVVNGFGWFQEYIVFYHQQRLSNVYREYILSIEGIEVDYPWFFAIYKAIKEGKLKDKVFDPWLGYRELDVEPPVEVQISMLKGQQGNVYHKLLRLQNKADLTQVEEEALEKFRVIFCNLNIEIEKLEEQVDYGG